MHKLKIITSTTRPTSQGIHLGRWITELAKANENFVTELLDLAVINLPFLDEPEHPRFHRYTKEHTKKWSAKITEADAFIIVLGEYNYGMPAPIKNALDFLSQEWAYKPVSFVTYGGIAAGTRSLQMIKLVVTALKMMPLTEVVNIPFFTKYLDEQGHFKADELHLTAVGLMLNELERWSAALKTLRTNN